MNKWERTSRQKYQRVILGYPYPYACPIAVRWSLTSSLSKKGHAAFEIYNFKTLIAELLRCSSYIAVIHVGLMDLEDATNADRAILLHLARSKPSCQYRIFDPHNLWEIRDGNPSNLDVWKLKSTPDIETLLLSYLEVWH